MHAVPGIPGWSCRGAPIFQPGDGVEVAHAGRQLGRRRRGHARAVRAPAALVRVGCSRRIDVHGVVQHTLHRRALHISPLCTDTVVFKLSVMATVAEPARVTSSMSQGGAKPIY